MQAVTFSVAGIPRPQPRPRFVKGRVISAADPNAKRWIMAVEGMAKQVAPYDGELGSALSVVLVFRFPTKDKARLDKPHTFRPDSDNLAKLVLDCLTRSGLIGDDSSVSSLSIRKSWDVEGGVDILVLPDCRLPLEPSPLEPPSWLGGEGVSGLGRFNQNGSEGI